MADRWFVDLVLYEVTDEGERNSGGSLLSGWGRDTVLLSQLSRHGHSSRRSLGFMICIEGDKWVFRQI